MRLLTFEVQTALGRFERLGAVAHGTIVDLTSAMVAHLAESQDLNAAQRTASAITPPDMIGFLEGGAQSRALAEAALETVGTRLKNETRPLGPEGEQLTFDEAEIRFLAPVPRPPMIRDGILILDHYKVGMERLLKFADKENVLEAAKTTPIYWKPSRTAVAGHQEPIRWPHYSEILDYEFELGMYIGKRGKNISAQDAWDHVAGYTVFNDLGLRDVQPGEMSLRMGPAKAKDFETSKIMGPYLVTADELPNIETVKLTTKVNGEVWFEGAIEGWAFTFADLIAYVSREETLQVGEFFGSGPPAYSCGFEIDRWVKPGDVVSCEIEGVGTLSNRIVRETASS
ncbi:MAG: fumarylacetoacetate hydrolase family protein [Rhizobiales bacterium]|nr:fumarylacetoacetate hydrolase family protein [Hyphomicrobiales bacterium]